MPIPIPSPMTLRDAVEEVIRQNVSIGYNPSRFRKETKAGYADNLVRVCDRLIQKAETFEALYPQVLRRPDTLTLEDLVVHSRHGREWGLEELTVRTAEARVEAWDQATGQTRWIPWPGTRECPAITQSQDPAIDRQ